MMKVTIYVREEDLEELDHFSRSVVPYEHRIVFYLNDNILSFVAVQVQISYDLYILLKEFQMKSTEHPYYRKDENRTNDSADL